jgi:uncharacterized protein (TIGR02246 family)
MTRVGIVGVVALAGCAHSPPAMQASVDAAHTAYANAMKGGDAKTLASLFTPDAVLVEATAASTVKGQNGVAQFYENLFKRAKVLDVIFQPETIQQDGNLGIETGRYILTLQPTSGEPLARTLRHLTVWRQQSDGTWLIQADASIIQVPNPPPF